MTKDKLIEAYRADYQTAQAIIDTLGVGEKGANLHIRLPLAIAAIERRTLQRAIDAVASEANSLSDFTQPYYDGYKQAIRNALEALRGMEG